MPLRSVRFRGNPRLESIAAGDSANFLRFGDQGDEVRAVQWALIDRGFPIPDGATGFFGDQTSTAVVGFKTQEGLQPNDPVVGKGTLGALDAFFALPAADHDEWASWRDRPIPDFNFTRLQELANQATAAPFTFNPVCGFLPQPVADGIVAGLTALLDPQGSPNGQLTASATWGASPLDLFHVHLVVDLGGCHPSWFDIASEGRTLHDRVLAAMRQADAAGLQGTPPWTAAYRALLLAPSSVAGVGFREATGRFLDRALANAFAVNQPLKLVWHSFEIPRWRPAGMASDDPRRGWWNSIAPLPDSVTSTPFAAGQFGQNVLALVELGFVVDLFGVITVMATTVTEAAAVVGLDQAVIRAAENAP